MFHLTSIEQLSRHQFEMLMNHTDVLRDSTRADVVSRRSGAIMATLFYEPSTRTRMSFESSILRLGGHVITAENALENSSAKKGESLEDVFRIVGSYADIIVIRHHETNAIERALTSSPVPIISAGSGAGEHPTQALLDAYTIVREIGHLDGLNITFVGDLKYGRTVHSLLKLLSKFDGVHVTVVHPEPLGLPLECIKQLTSAGLSFHHEVDFEKAVQGADVVYQTRIQRERLEDPREADNASKYHIHTAYLALMKRNSILMHPLPRVDEIHPDVDDDPRAAYFRQAENGVYVRMALCDAILGGLLK